MLQSFFFETWLFLHTIIIIRGKKGCKEEEFEKKCQKFRRKFFTRIGSRKKTKKQSVYLNINWMPVSASRIIALKSIIQRFKVKRNHNPKRTGWYSIFYTQLATIEFFWEKFDTKIWVKLLLHELWNSWIKE